MNRFSQRKRTAQLLILVLIATSHNVVGVSDDFSPISDPEKYDAKENIYAQSFVKWSKAQIRTALPQKQASLLDQIEIEITPYKDPALTRVVSEEGAIRIEMPQMLFRVTRSLVDVRLAESEFGRTKKGMAFVKYFRALWIDLAKWREAFRYPEKRASYSPRIKPMYEYVQADEDELDALFNKQGFVEAESSRLGLAMVWIVAHEVGHVMLGHLDSDPESQSLDYWSDEYAADEFARHVYGSVTKGAGGSIEATYALQIADAAPRSSLAGDYVECRNKINKSGGLFSNSLRNFAPQDVGVITVRLRDQELVRSLISKKCKI